MKVSHKDMFDFVEKQLEMSHSPETKIARFPFRNRYDHIRRVYMWANKLIDKNCDINREALLTAAIFHDVGYALSNDLDHSENSAVICGKYLDDNGFDGVFTAFVVYLVQNHSKKSLLKIGMIPRELIVLMEADLLDETGALSIVWDCMMEGAQKIQTFEKTYEHISLFSGNILLENPMITEEGKKYWSNKQKLVKEFIQQLALDLMLE